MAGKDFSGAVAELLRYCSDLPDAEVTETDGSISVPPAPVPPQVAITPLVPMTEAQWHYDCDLFAAGFLARSLAAHHGLDYSDVLEVLRTVPDNLAALHDTPQGWTVLAEQVLLMIGRGTGGTFQPSIH